MLRLVTLNLWQEQGPWEQRLELAGRRLADLETDVICLQEVRHVEGRIPNQAATLAAALGGMAWTYEPAQQWGGGEEGVGILSRWPLEQRAMCELPTAEGRSRRVCLGAHVRAPTGARVWVYTTHLAWRLDDGLLREQQVLAVDAFVRRRPGPWILAGDFNATPDADEVRFLRGQTTLAGRRTYHQDAFACCNPGAPGVTWARENPYTRQLHWLEPDRRLDYVFVSPVTREGVGRVRACRRVLTRPDTRGVWCSDHFGVLAEVCLTDRGEVGC